MRKFAVIGSPISHSLSPIMHNAVMGEEGVYTAIEVAPEDLKEFTEFARENLDGFNITLPLKQAIIPMLDDRSNLTSESCNTVLVSEGKLIGFSTDTQGLVFGLEQAFFPEGLQGKNIAFLGCGGAVVAALEHFSKICNHLLVINRTLSKAEGLKKLYPKIEVKKLDDDQLFTQLKNYDVLIQATSLGLKNDDPFPIAIEALPPHLCVYDLIYPETHFLQACTIKGLRTKDGRDMLLGQGAKSYEIWFGKMPNMDLMKSTLYGAILTRK